MYTVEGTAHCAYTVCTLSASLKDSPRTLIPFSAESYFSFVGLLLVDMCIVACTCPTEDVVFRQTFNHVPLRVFRYAHGQSDRMWCIRHRPNLTGCSLCHARQTLCTRTPLLSQVTYKNLLHSQCVSREHFATHPRLTTPKTFLDVEAHQYVSEKQCASMVDNSEYILGD